MKRIDIARLELSYTSIPINITYLNIFLFFQFYNIENDRKVFFTKHLHDNVV